MNLIEHLESQKLITPPRFLSQNTFYLTLMGSVAYHVSGDTSDSDIYGFCVPPKDDLFPHLKGRIPGFGKDPGRFEQYQQHHIDDKSAGKMYDVTVYSIVKYFNLLMENNPNMVDSIFTPINCVLLNTQMSELVRENRKVFLHKGSYHKFKSYAYQQLHKARLKTPQEGSKRAEVVKAFKFDVKFAYHLVRLIDECEQILVTHNLDITRDKERLKAIRRGEWEFEQVENFFYEKERYLEKLYQDSTLRHKPDEEAIKNLLLTCLEMHYGSLDKVVVLGNTKDKAIEEILVVLDKYKLL